MRPAALLASSLFLFGLGGQGLSQTAPTSPAPTAPAVIAEQSVKPHQPLFCTVTMAHSCTGATCTKAETLGDMKLPAKWLIHFESMVIAGTNADGFPHVSQIATFAQTNGEHVLQGVDHGIGWTIQIDEARSKMSLAFTSKNAVLAGTGTCRKPE